MVSVKEAAEIIRDAPDEVFDAALKEAGLTHKKAMAFLRALSMGKLND